MKLTNPLEERIATGIVVGRNLDENGTLTVFLLQSMKIVNRAKVLRTLNPNPELRTLIQRITTSVNPIGDDELIFRDEEAHRGGINQPLPSPQPTHPDTNDAVESEQNNP